MTTPTTETTIGYGEDINRSVDYLPTLTMTTTTTTIRSTTTTGTTTTLLATATMTGRYPTCRILAKWARAY
jgi:hypothetical protein